MVKANGRLLAWAHFADTRDHGEGPASGCHPLPEGRDDREQKVGIPPQAWEERVGAPRQIQDVGSRVFEDEAEAGGTPFRATESKEVDLVAQRRPPFIWIDQMCPVWGGPSTSTSEPLHRRIAPIDKTSVLP